MQRSNWGQISGHTIDYGLKNLKGPKVVFRGRILACKRIVFTEMALEKKLFWSLKALRISLNNED